MSHRPNQLASLLQERTAEYLARNFEVADVLVTITRVAVTPDLKLAKVFVSVLPDSGRGRALKALRRLTRDLNRSIFTSLRVQPVPKVLFAIDDIEVKANDIESLLDNLDS
jgi:ribosome-binding factor A